MRQTVFILTNRFYWKLHTYAELGWDVWSLLMASCQFIGELGRPGNLEVVILQGLIWLCLGPGAYQFSVLILSYNLKLTTPLLASVVAFLPQLCALHFLIWSGLEKSSCHRMLCFGFSHGLLMLTVAPTSWRLLGLQLECFRSENSCLTLSLFTLWKQTKSALEFEVGKNDPLKMHFGQGEEGFNIPAHL